MDGGFVTTRLVAVAVLLSALDPFLLHTHRTPPGRVRGRSGAVEHTAVPHHDVSGRTCMSRRKIGWTAALAVVLALVAVGLGVAVLTRYGPLDRPWGYVALVCAGFGAVAATLLCVVRAHDVVEAGPDETAPE